MAQQTYHKNFIKKLLSSKIFLFFIILALIGLAISVGRESYRKYQLTKEIHGLKSEIERLEGKTQQMADLMEYFQEGSYLEKEARLKLNLKKPGEQVVVISKEESRGEAGIESSLENQEETSLWSNQVPKEENNFWRWWEYFFTP